MTTIPPSLPPPPPPPPDTAQVEAIIRAIAQNAEALADLPAQRLVIRAQIAAAPTPEESQAVLKILTPRGEVRLELPPETPPLPPQATRPGTPVELEIPPRPEGEPPREVLLRLLTESTPAPLPSETPPPARGTETPVQVRLEPPPAPVQTPLPEILQPPQPGAPARLEPLPPALIPQIIKSLPAQSLIFTPAPDAFTPALSIATPPATRPEDIPDLPIRAVSSKIQPAVLTQTTAPLSPPSPLGGEGYTGLAPSGAYPALGEGALTTPSAPSSSAAPSAPPINKPLSMSVAAQPNPPATPDENPSLILKPQASADTLIAKVEGFVRADPINTLPTLTPVVSLPAFSFSTDDGQAPLYLLYTPAAASLVPGGEITLSITDGKPAAPQAAAPPQTMLASILPPYAFPAMAPQAWPLMDEIAHTLTLAAPAAAQALSNMTPNPASPGQITPAALFFIAAIRAGDLQSWLGDKAMDAIKHAGKSNLLSRLSGEGDALSRLAADPLPGEWRALPLPMAFQNELQKIALYYRHEAEDENEGDGKDGGSKGTRFIMDLNLSRIGPVQLDGYARPGKFDLILRTGEPFSAASRQAMKGIFTNALEIEGLKGELGFQSKPESWVRITGGKEIFSANA